MTDDPIKPGEDLWPRYILALSEIRRLRMLITDLEAVLAATRGTLAAPTPDDDEPASYTHDVPPNAPR